jgi:LEA14-like dessication related protein
MGLRGLLFGTKARTLATVLLLLVASVAGAYTLGLVGTPAVTDVENRFGSVDDEETTVRTDLVLSNPNPVGVSLGGASVAYTVSMNDVGMARGEREGLDLPAGRSDLGFTTRMDNDRIPAWWVTHVRNGERTEVRVDATVRSSTLGRSVDLTRTRTVETDIVEQFRSTEHRPVNADLPLVSDPVLVVRETDANWGTVTNRSTPIEMSFVVYNPKSVPYAVTEIGYNVTMNGVPVGNGTTETGTVLPPEEETTVPATTVIDNRRLDEWWVTHLENDQRTDLRIDFHATVDLPGGGTVRVPLDALTYTRTVETDIFGTKNASANGSTAAEDATTATTAPTDGGTATDGGATTAARPTATTAPTGDSTTGRPTAIPTSTDDGGLLGLGGNATDGEGTDDGPLAVGRADGPHGTLNLPGALVSPMSRSPHASGRVLH